MNVRKNKSKIGKTFIDGKGTLRIHSVLKESLNENPVSFK